MMISPRKSERITSLAVAFLFVVSLSNCCTDLELECENGLCLSIEKVCDGTIDCPGGADETSNACIHLVCPEFSFRCAYGACVPDKARCNGTAECADKSDEAVVLCNPDIVKENSICQRDEFECNSGQCISQEDVCDGRIDCLDRSDETVEVCASNTCEMFFRCGYGACLRDDKKCNGVSDCADGSDESFRLCGVEPPPQQQTMLTNPKDVFVPLAPTPGPIQASPGVTPSNLPPGACMAPYIENSRILFESNNVSVQVTGGVVYNFQSIVYHCQKGFFREGQDQDFCLNGEWAIKVQPTCTRRCPHEQLRGVSFNVKCWLNNVVAECDRDIKPGTVAKVTCPVKYRKPDYNTIDSLICLDSGEWDYPPFRCIPVCGEELIPSVPFLSNGDPTSITTVPWHVGVYINSGGKQKHHCGGTIISAMVVISAAHCFWDNANAMPYDKSLYKVGAGKSLRDYYEIEPRAPQFQNLAKIAIPEDFKGVSASYQADLAAVVLVNPLIFSDYVTPICIDWQMFEKQIKNGSYGKVAGWGKDETGTFSSTLKTIQVQASSKESCRKEVDPQYRDSITDDKFCVLNKHNTNACQGDSGGGFATKKVISGKDRYYLWGVVSTGVPLGNTCVNYQFVSYTNIQFYDSFITDVESSNRAR